MRTLRTLLPLILLAACYVGDPTARDEAPAPALDGPAIAAAMTGLEPDAAFDVLAEATGVPADLLAALAWVESGFSELDPDHAAREPAWGWMALTESEVAAAAPLVGLPPGRIMTEREAGLVAGAALLADIRDQIAPQAHPAQLERAWWDVVTAASGLGTRWLNDQFASEVFAVVQRGLVAPTEDLEHEHVVIPATELAWLQDVEVAIPPGGDSNDFSGGADYPGAARFVASPHHSSRSASIRKIVIHTTEGSYGSAVSWFQNPSSNVSAHYVVRKSDGEVTQMVRNTRKAWHAYGGNNDSIGIEHEGAAASPSTWTPQILESSARLSAWLSNTYNIPVNRSSFIGHHEVPGSEGWRTDPGPHFPWTQYLNMVTCFKGGGSDCGGASAAPGGEVEPPSGSSGSGSRPGDGSDGGGSSSGESSSGGSSSGEGSDGGGSSGGGASSGSMPSVPYFYQYANDLHPSASCQNTSIAMVLAWLGWNGEPDDITARFGKDLAQSPAGLAQVFNTLASEAGLSARLTPRTSGSLEGFNQLLSEGKPTIVHGYMTSYGHVVVALGRSGSDYVINDPAGRWAQTWKGGYPYGWNAGAGRGIRYSASAFEQAVATSNGSSFMPLWYHELTGVDPSSLPSTGTPGGGGSGSAGTPSGEGSGSSGSPDGGAEGPGSGGGGVPGSEGGAGEVGDESFVGWASVEWINPNNGDEVGNPVLMQAQRDGGRFMEFWSGPYRLGEPTVGNPTQQQYSFVETGQRLLTVKNLSEWGTVLAQSTISVNVEATGSIAPIGTQLDGLRWMFQAVTNVNSVVSVEYSVDGWTLTDEDTGAQRINDQANDWPLAYTFTQQGEDRVLVAKGFDMSGNLVAEGSVLLDVTGDDQVECAVVGSISCGETVSGDLTNLSQVSDMLNGYPGAVGNWWGPEVGFTWESTGGEVEIGFVDGDPGELDLDILILKQDTGLCVPDDFVDIAFNSLVFEAEAGASYTFVVDGYDGAAGPFQLRLDCDAAPESR